ncbi:hypothetical protein D9M71_602230 [compost metagenome]
MLVQSSLVAQYAIRALGHAIAGEAESLVGDKVLAEAAHRIIGSCVHGIHLKVHLFTAKRTNRQERQGGRINIAACQGELDHDLPAYIFGSVAIKGHSRRLLVSKSARNSVHKTGDSHP